MSIISKLFGKKKEKENYILDYSIFEKAKEEMKDYDVVYGQNSGDSLDDKASRAGNIMVLGSVGSGKVCQYIKPNLANSIEHNKNICYVITDPNGEIYNQTASDFMAKGYEVRVFNPYTKDAKAPQTHNYNPLAYINTTDDVHRFTNILYANTHHDENNKDPFWEMAEKALLNLLILYIIAEHKPADRYMEDIPSLLRAFKNRDVREKMFCSAQCMKLEGYKEAYRTIQVSSTKVLFGVIASLEVALAPFAFDSFKSFSHDNDMDDILKFDKPCVIYNVISTIDSTYGFLSLAFLDTCITHAFNKDRLTNKDVPYVHFVLDEFANQHINTIPNLYETLAVSRSYKVLFSIVLQDMEQLKSMYPNDWSKLIIPINTIVYMGGSSFSNANYMSELIGKTTISIKNSKSESTSTHYIMNPEEIARLDKDKCIICQQGQKPIIDKKIKIIVPEKK